MQVREVLLVDRYKMIIINKVVVVVKFFISLFRTIVYNFHNTFI
jgi:hypothetical protein